MQLRTNDKDEEKRLQEQREKDEVNEKPREEESDYVSISPPTTTLNSVHCHCKGIVPLKPLELRSAVGKALETAKSWDESQMYGYELTNPRYTYLLVTP